MTAGASRDASEPGGFRRGVPLTVWTLGFVSLFMDVSSEMIHAILPVYLVTVLGASTLTVGFIEGTAEAAANITKVFSGALSDRMGRRKPLAALGYGLGALSKPIFALARTVDVVVAARFIDRVGKGIRGAPRDALIADVTPPEVRGASYGLRQSLDTMGAFTGPLLAIALMALTGNAFRTIFWIAAIPAAISVCLVVFAVEEPVRRHASERPRARMRDVRRLGRAFWAVTAVAASLTLARFSEAFLVLRAQDVGLPVALVPVVMVVMNGVYAAAAYPAGALTDRVGGKFVMRVGILLLVLADVILALGATIPLTLLGVAAWGLHLGFTQGLFATLVAETSPPELRGSAFGIFNLAAGVMMLAASVIAGWLWGSFGASATFLAGAGFTLIAFVGVVVVERRPWSGGAG